MSDRLDKLEAELKDIRKELESNRDELKDSLKDFSEEAKDSGENILEDVKYYSRRGVDKVCQVTEESPWMVTGALTGIVIAGVVASIFLRRDNHEWRRYLPEDAINDLLRKIR